MSSEKGVPTVRQLGAHEKRRAARRLGYISQRESDCRINASRCVRRAPFEGFFALPLIDAGQALVLAVRLHAAAGNSFAALRLRLLGVALFGFVGLGHDGLRDRLSRLGGSIAQAARASRRVRTDHGSRALVSLPNQIESAMVLKSLAREHFGRGSVLGFVLILLVIVLVLFAIFWPVA
jgi:hypothetical protein